MSGRAPNLRMARPVAYSLLVWGMFGASVARAQVHWDASLALSATKRVLSERPHRGSDALPGPMVELRGEMALLPMVRVGGYVGHDVANVPSGPTRFHTSAGLRSQVVLPFVRTRGVIPYVALGMGGTHLLASGAQLSQSGFSTHAFVGLGSLFPVRGPWALFVEMAPRWGFSFWGDAYGPDRLGGGKDTLALLLTVGVSLFR